MASAFLFNSVLNSLITSSCSLNLFSASVLNWSKTSIRLAINKKYPIFDVDIIAPIPNHENDPYKNFKAVSIAKYFTGILKKNGNDNIEFKRNLLIKNIDIETKRLLPAEKELFYDKNQVYSVNEDSGNVYG